MLKHFAVFGDVAAFDKGSSGALVMPLQAVNKTEANKLSKKLDGLLLVKFAGFVLDNCVDHNGNNCVLLAVSSEQVAIPADTRVGVST